MSQKGKRPPVHGNYSHEWQPHHSDRAIDQLGLAIRAGATQERQRVPANAALTPQQAAALQWLQGGK